KESNNCKEYVNFQHFFKSKTQKEMLENIFSPQSITSCFRKHSCEGKQDIINGKDTTYYFAEGFVDISYQENVSENVYNKLLLKLKNDDPEIKELFKNSIIVCLLEEKPKLRLIFLNDC